MSTRVWRSLLTVIAFLLILISVVQLPHFSHYVERTLKQFLIWVQKDVGPWGPIILYVDCGLTLYYKSIFILHFFIIKVDQH